MPEGQIDNFSLPVAGRNQRTLKTSIGCTGIGLNTGQRVTMRLKPAGPGHGVVFRRIDLGSAENEIPARYNFVVDTRLGTWIADPERPELRVGPIEHLMAALAGCGINNVLAEIDGPELPALDGSASPFVFLLDCAGASTQDVARPTIRILRPVRVEENGGFAEFRPGAHARDMALSIDFPAAAVAREALSLTITPESFRRDLARARRFVLAHDLARLRADGLARGAALNNTIIIDESRVCNPEGLRMPDECVRHQLLDVIGDLALAGAAIRGRFIGHQTSHSLNIRLLQALFTDPANWADTGARPGSGGQPAGPA
ncbi:MAG: UDP-3-O-[3-hydroxymyristoyl] N-acetylglucosamine deacetylase [Acetobacteraceae bacterium]|nr:UDP-3-O-[3-hydroxymyristoyl] N-acetylglucosamine deacetylase [Acetobacteraceae bacterium]